jgi:hypothetical protein
MDLKKYSDPIKYYGVAAAWAGSSAGHFLLALGHNDGNCLKLANHQMSVAYNMVMSRKYGERFREKFNKIASRRKARETSSGESGLDEIIDSEPLAQLQPAFSDD